MDDPTDDRMRRLQPRLRWQAGVVRREQLAELGFEEHDIRRLLRRRVLVAVHPGVYVDHTGPLTWEQRAWAAVLLRWPAALCGESARRSADLRLQQVDDGRPIQVMVPHATVVRATPGVVAHRKVAFAEQVDATALLPRQRAEDWVLDIAAGAQRDLDAVAVIADAVAAGRTTAAAIRAALATRPRVRRRTFLTAAVDDVAGGTCSTLEHGYLVRVERAHGLPTASRQFRDSTKGTLYRDVVYRAFGVIVELDGRLFHSRVADRDRDLERDLDAAITRQVTARLGWGQVFDRPCQTASKIGLLLRNGGWTGEVQRCPRCP